MATIQVRDVPEQAYDTIRQRAKAAGQSIQGYMREQVIALAQQLDRAELFAQLDARLSADGGSRVTREQILAALDDVRGG